MILIISGFDGTASAGLLLDSFLVKNFSIPHYCIMPALTTQNHNKVIHTQVCDLQNQILGINKEPLYIKIGLLYSADIIKQISEFLYKFPNAKIICDTPIHSSSGYSLIDDITSYISAFKKFLLPMVYTLTPNTDEINHFGSIKDILQSGCKNILLKGGHKEAVNAIDTLYSKAAKREFSLPKINFGNMNVRGTGCALSTVIACYMCNGYDLEQAILKAKQFVYNGILNSKIINNGTRVLHWPLKHEPTPDIFPLNE